MTVAAADRAAAAIAEAQQLLDVETVDAWLEYLDQTRRLDGARYGEIEPWAWSRLQQRLRAIRTRRGRLRR